VFHAECAGVLIHECGCVYCGLHGQWGLATGAFTPNAGLCNYDKLVPPSLREMAAKSTAHLAPPRESLA